MHTIETFKGLKFQFEVESSDPDRTLQQGDLLLQISKDPQMLSLQVVEYNPQFDGKTLREIRDAIGKYPGENRVYVMKEGDPYDDS